MLEKIYRISTIALMLIFSASFAMAQNDAKPNAAGENELFPPNAEPGGCYARVFVPPQYETKTERVLKQEASKTIEVTPPEFETVEEKVLVKEASYKLELVPAEYETVEEQVLVKPATTKIEQVPAVYETVEQKVVDQPAATVWKEGRGPIEKIDNSTGEIMCLVEVPATYKTIKKKTLKSPATTKKVEIPAEYKTVKKRVVKTPPTTKKVEIPAEYDTVKVQKLVTDSKVKEDRIPEEYDTVEKKIKISEGKMEWKPVLCETNMSSEVITTVQESLEREGYDPGPIDGRIGSQTVTALKSYQKDRGLASGGLTMESLRKLGVLQ